MKVEFNEFKKEYEIFLGDLFIDNDDESYILIKVNGYHFLTSLTGKEEWYPGIEEEDNMIKKIEERINAGSLRHVSQKEYKLKVFKI